jgi:phosphoglycerate dehydrogenase-like enzyme
MGGFPRKLDYNYCFKHNIRVLAVAPAFARQVAEMALGMTLAASRDRAIHNVELILKNLPPQRLKIAEPEIIRKLF